MALSEPASIPPKPPVVPMPGNQFFWDGAAQGELLVQRCEACRHLTHPPAAGCPNCGARHLAPFRVSGRGVIYSFTIVRRVFHPAFAGDVPYAVAIVALEEQVDLHLVTAIVDTPLDAIQIGMKVEVVFRPFGAFTLPVFTVKHIPQSPGGEPSACR